jgi:hypothetical protein
MTDQELTPEERRALGELPAERPPSDLLEERVVRALHDRGLLRRERVRVLELTRSRVAAAVAACVLLAVTGFAVGRWTSSSTAQDLAAPPTEPARLDNHFAVAASLQQAAGAYVSALEEMEVSLQTADSELAHQGREVALASLYSAAGRVARFVPEDHLADRIREAVTAPPDGDERTPAGMSRRRLVEF